jgi:hypothetical protein
VREVVRLPLDLTSSYEQASTPPDASGTDRLVIGAADVCVVVAHGLRCASHTLHVDSGQSDLLVTLLVGVGGALLGAAAATIGQRMLLTGQARSERANRLEALRLEVAAIRDESATRVDAAADAGVRRDPPLPTDAWFAALSSSALHLFEPDLLTAGAQLYRRVESANYLAAQAPTYLLIAQTASTDDEKALFIEQARAATSSAFAGLPDAAAAFLEIVQAKSQ